METRNSVFIATSLDGYIADKHGGLAWLDSIPEINNIDTGYVDFTSRIDALVMGRNTFETVISFDIEWPYKKPVFVVSNALSELPAKYDDKAVLVKGTVNEIVKLIHQKGYHRLYIDGGKLITSFLQASLIDEMVITIIPTLLGDGIPLFSKLPHKLDFKCTETKLYLDAIVQNRYVRRS